LYNFYLNYIVYVFFWIKDTSIIIITSMLSCASNAIPQKGGRWRLFFEDLKFVASPPPQCLPIYAETVASVLAAQSSSSSTHSKSKRYDRRVLDFIDFEAES
jgi:hypothetical protein